jgi:hypothetical protein
MGKVIEEREAVSGPMRERSVTEVKKAEQT